VLREGASLGDRGVRSSAVVFGVIVDFATTVVGLFGLGIMLSLAARGSGATQAAGGFTAVLGTLLETPSVGLSLMGINTTASAIGGFAAAAAAGRAHVRHAFLCGCVVLGLGIFLALEAPDELAHWDSLGSLLLTLPAAVFGGWLARGRRR